MSTSESERAQWLKDTEEFFRHVQSYNTTIITVGYATFFAILFFLSEKFKSPLILWAVLCLVVSAIFFVAYELFFNIKFALEVSRAGNEGKRFFRFWAAFFVPSLVLGIVGVALLVIILLCNI